MSPTGRIVGFDGMWDSLRSMRRKPTGSKAQPLPCESAAHKYRKDVEVIRSGAHTSLLHAMPAVPLMQWIYWSDRSMPQLDGRRPAHGAGRIQAEEFGRCCY